MARRCFFSFHYHPDNWRASQVRNIGTIEGNRPASDNNWESIKKVAKPPLKRGFPNKCEGVRAQLYLWEQILRVGSGSIMRSLNHGMKVWV